MSWNYDPLKPMSEKTAADWATDYMIYEEVTKDWDSESGSGSSKPPKPPKKPDPNPEETAGCGYAILFAVVLLLVMVGIAFLADSCMLSLHRQSDEERQSSMVASRVSEYEATRNATTQPTTEETYTTSYRYTTRRYTTQKNTTRDDPYDAYGYLDADDFAAENYEEFDDYDEAYDYYEDYMAGYD